MNIPTASELKSEYLFGIPLTDGNGNTYSDTAISKWIARAVEKLETILGICIVKKTITLEPHDYRIEEYSQFCFLQLYKVPVISVSEIKAKYGGQDVMTFPVEWVKCFQPQGQIQLVPTVGSLSQVLLGRGSGTLLPLITGALSNMPFLFEVTYIAGFNDADVPADICDAIGMQAAIGVLGIMGDLVLAPGISSVSLSMDGLSQNFSSVKSAQGGAYAGRMNQYQKDLNEVLLPALQRKYHGLRLVVA